jgi:hypothetical protein
MRTLFLSVLCAFSISTYAQLPVFNAADQPAAPDYTNEAHWSALPFRVDAADLTPGTEQWISDSLKDVDVFYIYPTIYVKGKTWNADLKNKKLNKRIDEKPVKYQASVFNESCRVYAPRYRQSILKAFSTLKTSDGKPGDGYRSLDFAYQDVKAAFEYYLKHYNNGRPIIIAGHSQGTYHARRLLQEYFDSTNLRNRLVAAYIIGYGITRTMYTTLKPCDNSNQTGCYITYASFKQGYDPGTSILYGDVTVNPVTWTTDTAAIACSNTLGGLLLNPKKGAQKLCDVQIHNNYLWVKVNYPVVRNWDNLHIADYNLFWYDIRKNVKDRISAFWKK